MYHWIVGRVVRRTFEHLNARDYHPVIAQYDANIRHSFAGDHALSGTRNTVSGVEKWYRRLFDIFADLHFTPRLVVIQGMPWHTNVAVKVDIAATVDGGTPYANELAMFVTLKWGRIVRISMHEDTQKLAGTLLMMAAHGHVEAAAAPILI